MTVWTDERKAEARRLWMAGYSASLIAESIGNDCTKNSIIGLAHRGKWGQRRPAYARSTAPKQQRRPRVKPADVKARTHAPKPAPPPPSVVEPRLKPGTYTLLDLRPHECRWPMNAPPRGSAAYFFCGEPQVEGRPYCRGHCDLGYQKGTALRRPEVGAWLPRPVEVG